MLLFLQPNSSAQTAEALLATLKDAGLRAEVVAEEPRRIVRVHGGERVAGWMSGLPAVQRVVPAERPLFLSIKDSPEQKTTVRLGDHVVGAGATTVIAGPCAVEDPELLTRLALDLKGNGVHVLRGGAYKPRSSPYDFQGLGEEGLRILAEAGRRAGLPVVTEAVDAASLDLVERHAQVLQIGARNMHNFELLKRAGESPLPILLKRGFSATLEDLLLAAEYVLERGNDRLMLCERGIRTFSTHSRFTLDLAIVPRLQELSHLPVLVDPSHASGRRGSVAALACAAVAAGADGVMIEVHPHPERALCDGDQALTPDAFATLAERIRCIAGARDGAGETVP